ncbi:biliverdin-producing heme oxygenase [Roseomonas sp. OT10]|uniref:biliverdin-producing heme oxygenase n=1 Tax=Roseomonas cutis TaxID=2897332 RepID=UPI001E540569|nr:biliverdin-producing heme oxygenase [Roseomonas sp. OT10]UFN49745.1 biliverdin-producing heme oxygenase [Roseomonas sp. OT10]
MPAPVLSALRAATETLHARLEERFDLDRCLASRADYAAMLGTLLGVIAPLEAALGRFDWLAAGLDPEVACWRTPRIEDDLGALGLGRPEIEALPRCAALPGLPSPDAGFGALYVLEGSALGGQLILRRAREALGVSPGDGASFHAALGRPPVGEGWRAFRAALEAHCTDIPAAAAAAATTFQLMEGWAAARAAAACDRRTLSMAMAAP